MPEDLALETRALTKRFGELIAVNALDLAIAPGSVHGLLGRNGAGKTTLMRMILGLLSPDAGAIELFGRSATPGDVDARARVAGFVEEPRFYPYLSGRRNLELLARLDGRADTRSPEEALELVDLDSRGREKVGNFSTGMRQRLGLAAALLRPAELVVLDEPTIGLDPANARTVRTLIGALSSRGVAVLLSSHNMSEIAEICDRVTIIHEGSRVWEGDQAELLAAAPAPSYRVWTSDDDQASAIARRLEVAVETPRRAATHTITVQGDEGERDGFVLALAQEGIAIRRLEPDVPPLEALFTSLTSPRDADQPAQNTDTTEEIAA
ncbi:ABC transporter ATP-binding protein [Gryllotalpicola daejeonensis]|uniref:ABC transporter ATP-binding protein n=1 Tax=Gryllotalpicola daejeonensis TaxID=993087 RepID=A0ABP7ZFB7_9MICO